MGAEKLPLHNVIYLGTTFAIAFRTAGFLLSDGQLSISKTAAAV
jgi:hypothetical protein